MKTEVVLFWVFLFIVFYTYIGYGVVLYCLVWIKDMLTKPVTNEILFEDLPEVTLLISAYNEEDIIDEKMYNTMALDYPPEKLKVIWITDGSTDSTNLKLSKYENVKVLFESERRGKTAAINRAFPFVDSSITIFTDANTLVNQEAVNEIVKAFSDSMVGCVAGEKRIAVKKRDIAVSGGEGIYWKYESFLKALDSRLNTTVGAAGELFAIRSDLFEPMGTDTLLDDFIMSMKIAQRGYKIAYCSDAYAIETGSYSMLEEKKRKIRIAAGGIQSVYRLSNLLNIFRYPILSFQYVSHRVLRWTITPFLLFALLPLNILIVLADDSRIYIILLILQSIFYLVAFLGLLYEDKKVRFKYFFIPHYFIFMNINVIRGIIYLIKKRKGDGTWERARRGV